jgi:hypothetical protein
VLRSAGGTISSASPATTVTGTVTAPMVSRVGKWSRSSAGTGTEQGREQLRRWLDEPPATRSMEFEGMLKLFFADAGSLDQLAVTLTAIERDAAERLAELAVSGSRTRPWHLISGFRLRVRTG